METKNRPARNFYVTGITAIIVLMMGLTGCSNVRNSASKLIKETGLSGGLIVHLECEDEQEPSG